MATAIKAPPWSTVEFYKNKKEGSSYFNEGTVGSWVYNPNEKEKELYSLRSRIEEYEKGDKGAAMWEYYKKVINPYELIYTQPKFKDLPLSVCLLNPLSRSYFKMIEILNVSGFFEANGRERLKSAHVCEGPGGFIEGFYDECEKRRLMPLSANAITLKPQQANVPGWKRATTFLQKYKSVQIHYGADNTGNILNYENQNSFIASCPKVLLFTGDGGFDFSTDYSTQEEAIYPLLISSVRIGFECMRSGAYFILKFFDLYSEPTIDLIYYLSLHFKSWTLYKPATSRPCNPEHYFIGIDYKGCSSIDLLRNWSKAVCSGSKLASLGTGERCTDFTQIIHNIREKAVNGQINYLNQVFQLIEHPDTIKPPTKVYEVLSYDWCRTFNVPVHPYRALSIEVSRSDLLASGQL
jgi:23S rRNA U2552 (ribose-2'-O)-methylase RlmE/FtsJ